MTKLLISVFCPPTSRTYDFWIPADTTVVDVIALLCDDIRTYESSPGLFAEVGSLILHSYLLRKTLPMERTLEQAGVRSGDKLALL